MLCEEDQQLFLVAREGQINRNTAIHMIETANARDLIVGVYVRVLLELPSHQEDYVIARVQDIVEGEPYMGFSTDPAQTTTTYLVLHLPTQLATINGVQYQLNSVSNSTMREAEFARWLAATRTEEAVLVPTHEELVELSARVRRAVANANAAKPVRRNTSADTQRRLQQQQQQQQQQSRPPLGSSGQVPAQSAGGPPAPLPMAPRWSGAASQSLESVATAIPRQDTSRHLHPPGRGGGSENPCATSYNGTAPGATVSAGGRGASAGGLRSTPDVAPTASPAARAAAATALNTHNNNNNNNAPSSEEAELARRLRQEIVNHLSQDGVLFPKDASEYKLSQLRLVERDMMEYLQHVRDEIAAKRENCVVCMDHVPTVILLPCKHKVLCRLCAPSCSACPLCRSEVAEMFEPEEV